jgi:uncharacterized Zn-binding protein involved in type VI secretion
MGQPAAAQGDWVVGTDTHLVVVGAGAPAPVLLPFAGQLDENLSTDVRIAGRAAAVVGSAATNTPPHVPPGGSFVRPPTNRAVVQTGSSTVRINGRSAARAGDPALTCNDPNDLPAGSIVALCTVRIGG